MSVLVQQQVISRSQKTTFRKRTGSLLMSAVAIAFTAMPLVTIGIWTTQFFDVRDISALFQAVTYLFGATSVYKSGMWL